MKPIDELLAWTGIAGLLVFAYFTATNAWFLWGFAASFIVFAVAVWRINR